MMRLVRRTLLCLIVGVTAFGVSGWLLRPKPNWSVTVQEPGFEQRVEFHEDPVVTGPAGVVWLWSARSTDDGAREDVLIGLDETNGRVARRIRCGDGEWTVPLPNGRVLYERETRSFDRSKVVKTNLRLTDRNDRTIAKHEWPGGWGRTQDGSRAWGFEWKKGGVSLVVRDVETGEVVRKFSLDGVHVDDATAASELDVSRDAKLLAVGERLFKDRKAPFGVELWDVVHGKLLRRLQLPMSDRPTSDEGATQLQFSQTRPHLAFGWKHPDEVKRVWLWTWRYDAVKESDVLPWGPPVPTPSKELALRDPSPNIGDEGRWLWTASDNDRSQFWFSIQDDHREWLPWRKFPRPILPIKHGGGFFESFEPECRLAPNSNGIVFAANDLPILGLVSEALRGLVWESASPEMQYLWFDWKANAWHDVGLKTPFGVYGDGFYEKRIIVRSNALLHVRHEPGGDTIVESWPLPPRDPKWPAAGVAALCMAGTWWACARRYRRRMKQATIPSVTA